jgi:hypothetical protein
MFKPMADFGFCPGCGTRRDSARLKNALDEMTRQLNQLSQLIVG